MPSARFDMTGSESTVQNQINMLSESMQRGFQELKELLQNIDQRVRQIETSEARCQPVVFTKIDAAWRKIDEHEVKLTAQEKRLVEFAEALQLLRQTNKILAWLGGILGGTGLVLILTKLLGLVIK